MEYQKTAEATGDLIGSKSADAVRPKALATRAKSHDGKINEFTRSSPQNNSETITHEHDKEIPKQRYISPKKDRKLLIIWHLI